MLSMSSGEERAEGGIPQEASFRKLQEARADELRMNLHPAGAGCE
jgi:hypothetical protein